jgi:hypothetical protein
MTGWLHVGLTPRSTPAAAASTFVTRIPFRMSQRLRGASTTQADRRAGRGKAGKYYARQLKDRSGVSLSQQQQQQQQQQHPTNRA